LAPAAWADPSKGADWPQFRGPQQKWRAVNSLIVTGTEILFSTSAPFVFEFRRPDRVRFEQTLLGQKMTIGHDGTVTWWVHPLFEIVKPTAVPESDAVLARHTAEFESPLLDAAAKGHTVELLGKDEIDGQPAWKLKVTRKDGFEETWYLDTSTHLELARFDRTLDLPEAKDRWTYYSDFRTVEGLVIPHRQDQEYSIRHVSLTIEKVQANPEIEAGGSR
jgi:hypothetical protein